MNKITLSCILISFIALSCSNKGQLEQQITTAVNDHLDGQATVVSIISIDTITPMFKCQMRSFIKSKKMKNEVDSIKVRANEMMSDMQRKMSMLEVYALTDKSKFNQYKNEVKEIEREALAMLEYQEQILEDATTYKNHCDTLDATTFLDYHVRALIENESNGRDTFFTIVTKDITVIDKQKYLKEGDEEE